MERFYAVNDRSDRSPKEELDQLRTRLRDLCGSPVLPTDTSITFITGELPFGFGFPEAPSTHLERYPDLGITMVNGFAAEQPGTAGIGVAVLVDPSITDAPEIEAATQLLPPRGTFVRGYQGPAANVTDVEEMMELFPYDLLLIATHCGDAPGYRWTYEYVDSEGIDRSLVVDIALGVGRTDDRDLLNVTQFIRFVSLDGIDWKDEKKKRAHYVGKAIIDFMNQTRSEKPALEPVKKDTVERVLGSAALRMSDNNLLTLPRSLADKRTPIIINNACVSWHELSGRFTFGNARAYIGTLVPVTTTEAHEVIVRLLGKHFDKPLPHALWSAQRDVYGQNTARRPYVMTGIYPQRLRTAPRDVPEQIKRQLSSALREWRDLLAKANPSDESLVRGLRRNVQFYERELRSFASRW